MCRRRSRLAAAEAEPSNAPARLPKVRNVGPPLHHFTMPLLVSVALLLFWSSDRVGLPLVNSQEIGGFGILRRRQPPPSQLELLGMDPIVGSGHRYAKKDNVNDKDHDNVFDHQQLKGAGGTADDILGEDFDHRAKGKSKKKDSYNYEYYPPDKGGSYHGDGEHGGDHGGGDHGGGDHGGDDGGGGGEGQCKLRRCYRYCNTPKKECGEDCKAIKKLCRKKDCTCHLETCNQFCKHWREYCHRRGISPRQCRRHKRKCGCGRPPRPPPTPAPPPTRRPRAPPTKAPQPTRRPPTARPPTRPQPTQKQCTPKCERFCNRPTKACGSDPECLETREDCYERCDCRPVTCKRFCIEFGEEPRTACDNQGWNDAKCLREALFCECAGKEPEITSSPTSMPTTSPSTRPTTSISPSGVPSTLPSSGPSSGPSSRPSQMPSASPSNMPSKEPSISPSDVPSSIPSKRPTIVPFNSPSASPSASPSLRPSASPSNMPTDVPSLSPSALPSLTPSASPSTSPSDLPSQRPSNVPSTAPSVLPSKEPSLLPSAMPSSAPSSLPSRPPRDVPSTIPSASPSHVPSTAPSGCGSPGGFCGPDDDGNTGFCCQDPVLECQNDGTANGGKFRCLDPLPSPLPSSSPSSTPSVPGFDNNRPCTREGCPIIGGPNCKPGPNGELFTCQNLGGLVCAEDVPTACPTP